MTFHYPTGLDLIVVAGWTLFAVAFDFTLSFVFERQLKLRPRFALLVLFFLANQCNEGGHGWVMLAYFALHLLLGILPWNRWRKGLASKAAELTEVTRAALKREQAEAFS